MKRKLLSKKIGVLSLFFLLCGTLSVSAQTQKTITGTVIASDDNQPMPGATVLEKGRPNGVTTDIDGNFTIDVSSESKTIVISFIGYKDQEVGITNSPLKVILEVDINTLDDIVVVGYGTLKKSDVVSSVASIDVGNATTIPSTNINEMMRGQAAGVQVTVGSLRPGGSSDIIIRGKNSLAGNNSPIYVVDGVPKDDINDISPEDITSIEILKDASAQAIYGSRASNGVVVVTTKRGEEGKVSINYHGYFTTSSISKNFDLYNGGEYAQLRREAYRTDNASDDYENDDFIFTPEELASIKSEEYVNWEDEVVNKATTNSHTVSLSGGTEKTKVFSSINYFSQEGIIPTSAYKRGSFRLNLDQIVNDKLSVAFNVYLTTSLQNKESGSMNLITLSPLAQAHDDKGELVRYPTGETSYTSPLWNIRESDNDIKGNSFDINFVLNYNITDHFKYKLNTALGRRTREASLYYSTLHSSAKDVQGYAKIMNSLSESLLIENIFTYNNQFNDNNKFDITFVQSVDERKFTGTTTSATGFSNDVLGYNGIGSALVPLPIKRKYGNQTPYERKLVSFMTRFRYTFMDRYLFTLTARADGSSVFAEGKKWGVFPSAAFAWKLDKENFLKDVDFIDQLKLRTSYGTIGNEAIKPYQSLGTASEYLYTFGGVSTSGYLPGKVLPNPNLKWETTTSLNVGLDFSIIKNKISGSVDYYNTKTNDLLIQRSVSGITGYSSTFANAGEVQNKGIELLLSANVLTTSDFNWNITATYAKNSNIVNDLYGNDELGEPINDRARGYFVGQPIRVIRTYAFDGIWQDGEDYANSAQSTQPNIGPGSIRVKDINGDGKITVDDEIYVNPNPDWFGSLSTTVAFKNFELFADLYTVQGVHKYNPYLADFNSGGTLQGKLNGIKVPYYTPEHPSDSYPRPRASAADPYLNSLAVQDASYIRLRTVSLAYKIPNSLTSKIGIEMVKLYVTGTNVFTITDYLSYSPEVNNNGYPDAKSFTFGVRANF